MYGSLDDDETGFGGAGSGGGGGAAGGGGGTKMEDPLLLLPPRGPSTAETRKSLSRKKKRVSVSQRNALRAAASRRSQMFGGLGGGFDGGGGGGVVQQKPIMKTLFHDNNKKKNKKSLQQQQKKNPLPPKSSPAAPVPLLDIETLQELVPEAGTTTTNGQHPQQQQQQQQQQPKYQLQQQQHGQEEEEPSRQETEETEALLLEQQQRKRNKQHQHHSWLYVLLHPNSSHPHAIWYKWFISIIILLDVAFFVASTEEEWNNAFPQVFYYEEGIVSAIFLLEYCCRVTVAPESHKYYNHLQSNYWQARFQYMKTTSALMDAAAALPFFLELPTGLALPNLTWIRFFRLLRILKTGSYARSMQTVYRVIYYNREILYVALNICILLVLVTAVLMYYLRPQNNVQGANDDDDDNANEQFKSLLSTMYLSTLMLTGQGGPDGNNLPWYTKFVVLLTGFFSVAMFAIPASMLTWGFEAEAERCARKAQRKYYRSSKEEEEAEEHDNNNNNNNNNDDDDNSYSKYVSSSSSDDDDGGGGDTTDEEYLNIIAGGEEEGGDEDGTGAPKQQPAEDEVVKKLIRTFQTSDVDASGSLSMDEFIELMTSPELASMGMIGMATSMGLLAKRVHHLENELDRSHKKLDQLLELLLIEQQKKK